MNLAAEVRQIGRHQLSHLQAADPCLPSNWDGSFTLIEILFVHPLEVDDASGSYPDAMLDHQGSKLGTVDQHDALSQVPRILPGMLAECRSCNEDPLGRTEPNKAADEGLDFRSTDYIAQCITFRLDVNAVQAKAVFTDYPVNAAISRLSNPSRCIGMTSAISHCNQ